MACRKDRPLEREQEDSRIMAACSVESALDCVVSAVTAKSCPLQKLVFSGPSLLFHPHSGNAHHPWSESQHCSDPRSFHIQISSLRSFLSL